ncbi:MAG TPA: PQQ-binding-like beta-propeller repeat protein [Steroidobacteraceae bacterium]|nr:PQQ-binding-like beta-propeller repeat protein [Steroidobacteraceae bacterium]
MRSSFRRHSALSAVACLALAAQPASAADLEFEDLAGWWHGPLEHAGQTSEIYAHLLEVDGKPTMRLSMVAMDAWEVPIGTVTIKGDRVDTDPYPFPLEFDREEETLSGVLLEAAVPVYRIPVTLRRIDPPAIPAPRRFEQPAPEVAWTADVGAPVWAGLTLDEAHGFVIVATEAGDVMALDRSTGAFEWRQSVGAAVRARPTLDGAHLYVVADDGRLSKLDAASGRIRWQRTVDSGGPPRIPIGEEGTRYDRYASRVIVQDGRLYLGGRDGRVRALDAVSGASIWQFATGDIITAAPALDGDVVVAASFDHHVYGLDIASGKERWRRDLEAAVPGDIVIADGVALAGSRSYDLVALDVRTGEPRWQYYYWFSWIESPAQVVDGTAYVGSSDALSLFAFDVGSGRLLWQTKVPGWAWPQPAVRGDEVYVATIGLGSGEGRRNGAVTAMDRRSGEILWVHRAAPIADAPQWGYAAAPIAAGTSVYAADLAGRVVALRSPGAS